MKEEDKNIRAELDAVLEDDAGMRQITPLPEIREHLATRFGEEKTDKVIREVKLTK